jgi:hypothetical protein
MLKVLFVSTSLSLIFLTATEAPASLAVNASNEQTASATGDTSSDGGPVLLAWGGDDDDDDDDDCDDDCDDDDG